MPDAGGDATTRYDPLPSEAAPRSVPDACVSWAKCHCRGLDQPPTRLLFVLCSSAGVTALLYAIDRATWSAPCHGALELHGQPDRPEWKRGSNEETLSSVTLVPRLPPAVQRTTTCCCHKVTATRTWALVQCSARHDLHRLLPKIGSCPCRSPLRWAARRFSDEFVGSRFFEAGLGEGTQAGLALMKHPQGPSVARLGPKKVTCT